MPSSFIHNEKLNISSRSRSAIKTGQHNNSHGAVRAYLDSCFSQVNLHGQFFPHEHIRISGLLESFLQLLQLLGGEVCSVTTLFAPPPVVIGWTTMHPSR